MRAVNFFAAAAVVTALAVPARAQDLPATELEQAKSSDDKALAPIAGRALNKEMDAATHTTFDGAPNDRAASGFRSESFQFSSTQSETDVSLAASFDLGSYDRSRVKNPRDNFFFGQPHQDWHRCNSADRQEQRGVDQFA